jgi:O-antigen/teichoic acid export membrane protein
MGENMNRTFIKDFFLVFASNGIGLLLSLVMNIILPVIFKDSVAAYGYVQLYLLYVSYYYIFDFGLSNGVYLIEGGKEYNTLKRGHYSGQFWVLGVSQVIVGIVITVLASIVVSDGNKQFVFFIVAANIVFMQLRTLLLMIDQATNRIKQYSNAIIICKLLNTVAILLALLFGIRDYKLLIILLTVGEVASCIYAGKDCKELLLCKPEPLLLIWQGIKENIRAGFSILISGLSSMLMMGFTRLAIEEQWGIEMFAKVSFTIGLSNMFMLFINAVSVVLYPQMKRTSDDKYITLYDQLRNLLMLLLITALLLYYPMRLLLEYILPEYHESLSYMAILLPICLYSSKMALLLQTYMKVLRLERKLMKVNLIALFVAVTATLISVFILNDLTISVLSILLSQVFRTIYAEIILSKCIRIHVAKDIAYEFAITAVFVVANWLIGGWTGMGIYFIVLLLYIVLKYKGIKELLHTLPRRAHKSPKTQQ